MFMLSGQGVKVQHRNEIAVCLFDLCSVNHACPLIGRALCFKFFHMGLRANEMGGIETGQLFYPSHLVLLCVGSSVRACASAESSPSPYGMSGLEVAADALVPLSPACRGKIRIFKWVLKPFFISAFYLLLLFSVQGWWCCLVLTLC